MTSFQPTAIFAVFSGYLGAVLAISVVLAADAMRNRLGAARSATAYMALAAGVALLGGGWAESLFEMDAWVSVLLPPWIAATTCAGVIGVRRWLGFPWRGAQLDAWLRAALWCGGVALLVSVAAWLVALGNQSLAHSVHRWSVLVAALAAGVALGLCAWVCTQMAKLGDQLAWWLTGACALTIPGVLAIGAVRGGWLPPLHPAWWALLAALHALGLMCSAVAAVRHSAMRNARSRNLEQTLNFDAMERLPTGERLLPALGPKFDLARARGVSPAVLVIHVFNQETITEALGTGAADQVALATLARLQGALNPKDAVARYFDACFVVLIHAAVDTHYLRERCLRIAASVRRPVALRGATALANDNEPVDLDIGVGACWSDQVGDMATAMQQAAAASAYARSHPSKASVVIYPGRPPLPVELVLGGEVVVAHAAD